MITAQQKIQKAWMSFIQGLPGLFLVLRLLLIHKDYLMKNSVGKDLNLCLFYYRIVNQLDVPSYLSALLPSFIVSSGSYHLRHNLNFKAFKTKSSMYQQSFFPSCVKLWNSLPDEQKCAPSIDIFKRHLTSAHIYCPPRPPDYFGYGNRRHSVLLTQLRLGHGLLQQQRFNVGLTNDPSCTCGLSHRDALHPSVSTLFCC